MDTTIPWQRSSFELRRIGLARLRMALPQYRSQLKQSSEWDELAEAYALAVLYLEHLRRSADSAPSLVAEYEEHCQGILADIAADCERLVLK